MLGSAAPRLRPVQSCPLHILHSSLSELLDLSSTTRSPLFVTQCNGDVTVDRKPSCCNIGVGFQFLMDRLGLPSGGTGEYVSVMVHQRRTVVAGLHCLVPPLWTHRWAGPQVTGHNHRGTTVVRPWDCDHRGTTVIGPR